MIRQPLPAYRFGPTVFTEHLLVSPCPSVAGPQRAVCLRRYTFRGTILDRHGGYGGAAATTGNLHAGSGNDGH